MSIRGLVSGSIENWTSGKTYAVRLSGHVELSTLKLGEVLEEDGDEGRDVLGSFFGGAL